MFKQCCFIRKNNVYLIKKLKDLGYNTLEISNDDECIATASIMEYAIGISNYDFDNTNPHNTWNCCNRIDCGTNEKLFLAIAALRDDTDKNQWFTDGNGDFWFKLGDDKIDEIKEYYEKEYEIIIHKASVEELIEHFKD